jgi:hypothetical protein
MNVAFNRVAGIAILTLLLVGAYTLIAGQTTDSSLTATAKHFAAPIKPPNVAGEIQEGTGI